MKIFTIILILVLNSCGDSRTSNNIESNTRKMIEYCFGSNLDREQFNHVLSQALEGNGEESWAIATSLLEYWGTYAHTDKRADEVRELANQWMLISAKHDYPLAIIDLAKMANGLNESQYSDKEDVYLKKAFNLLMNKEFLSPVETHYLDLCYKNGWGTVPSENWRQSAE